MATCHWRMDKAKILRTEYHKRPDVRRRSAKGRALKIRENIRREYVDKKAGKTYGAGSNDPSAKLDKSTGNKKQKRTTKSRICEFCGKKGHSTKRSKNCTYTTSKDKVKAGKFRPIGAVRSSVSYVNVLGTCNKLQLILRTFTYDSTDRECWRAKCRKYRNSGR
jgi:hypothetical protein